MTVFSRPGSAGALMSYESRYQNFIGGQWVAPVHGRYFENPTPVTGQPFCEVPRSDAADIDKALDAAHAAAPGWGKTAPAERAAILNMIADRIDKNAAALAVAEVWDNGKPVREALAADIPLAVDHFRYFAAAIRAQEGALSQIDEDTVAYHFHEPLGVVGQIIPWNFPILMAAWKLAPALAAGNTAVLKPAEQTPASVLYLMSLIGDLLPPGVVNVVNGFGAEAGKPLASSDRIAKVAFTGETTTGRLIMQYASHNLIPVTLELGGKSPNIFFADVLAAHDDFCDKALEGFTMFALNQGEVCTCPSRSLIQADIYDEFLELAATRNRAVCARFRHRRTLAAVPLVGRPAGQGGEILARLDAEAAGGPRGCRAFGQRRGAGVRAGRHASALGYSTRSIYLPEVVEVRSSGPRRMDRCWRGRPELVLLVVSHTRQDGRRVRRPGLRRRVHRRWLDPGAGAGQATDHGVVPRSDVGAVCLGRRRGAALRLLLLLRADESLPGRRHSVLVGCRT